MPENGSEGFCQRGVSTKDSARRGALPYKENLNRSKAANEGQHYDLSSEFCYHNALFTAELTAQPGKDKEKIPHLACLRGAWNR